MNANPIQYKCRCGHELRLYDPAPESYSLLNERNYEELIVNEAQLFRSENDRTETHSELFFNQSQRIGRLVICPECGRLIVVFPREPGREADQLFHFYCKEEIGN